MQDRPGGCPDELVPVAEAQVQRQSDADQRDQTAWDASDAARPDVTGDAVHQPPALPEDADAGKSAVLVPDDLVQGDRR